LLVSQGANQDEPCEFYRIVRDSFTATFTNARVQRWVTHIMFMDCQYIYGSLTLSISDDNLAIASKIQKASQAGSKSSPKNATSLLFKNKPGQPG